MVEEVRETATLWIIRQSEELERTAERKVYTYVMLNGNVR